MDNEAFRALVRKSAAPRTTKEIAREAVEGEFERRKRRRGQKRAAAAASRHKGKNRSGDDADAEYDDEYSDGAVSSSEDEDGGGERDGGDGDGEGGAADGGGDGAEPKWKRLRREKRKKRMEEAGITQYRDRAKERRKGLDLDYQDTSALLDDAGEVDKDMSKFLGGDEKHTHLVKGLDLALAQRVRREEMGGRAEVDGGGTATTDRHDGDEDLDLDEVMDAAITEAHRRRRGDGGAPTTALARRSMLDELRLPSSALGQSVLSHLRRSHAREAADAASGAEAAGRGPASSAVSVEASLAGRAIQRSTLSFSVDCNIHDRSAAWEVPRESTLSRAQHEERARGGGGDDDDDGGDDGNFVRVTPLDDVFVGRIRAVLSERRRPSGGGGEEGKHKHKHKHKAKKDKKRKKKHGKMDISDLGTAEAADGGNAPVPAEDDICENERDEGAVPEIRPARFVDDGAAGSADADGGGGGGSDGVNGNGESDDDIFGDAGEYVPPSKRPPAEEKPPAKEAATTSEGGNGGGASFFSDSTKGSRADGGGGGAGDGQRKGSSTERPAATLQLRSIPSSKRSRKGTSRLIDRDVIGGRSEEPVGRQSADQGVSIASYAGGYGEEMDVDFDGAMEKDDREEKQGGKSSKYETTTAALEYGGRGKRKGKGADPDGDE